MEVKKRFMLNVIIIISLTVFASCLSIVALTSDTTNKFLPPTSLNEIIDKCYSNNESIENVSKCFILRTKTFFNYSMDDTRVERNDGGGFSEKIKVDNTSVQYAPIKDNDILLYLKENGGSCTEWTLYYEELCKMTNFKCESVRNGGISGVFYYHQYLVMYNDDTYCKLDQTKVECKNITVKRNI